jgi:tRNA threonylcarbamoyladenosine biosynthesis protein TsaE
MIFTSDAEEETLELGRLLGSVLEDGDFVGLVGTLGAGKTLFARGVATGLGIPTDDVSSPTYAIVQSYPGRFPLHHADLYRLRDEADLFGTGYFDLVDGPGAFLVEWIDHIRSAAPSDHLRLTMTARNPARQSERTLEFTPSGPKSSALLRRFEMALGQRLAGFRSGPGDETGAA